MEYNTKIIEFFKENKVEKAFLESDIFSRAGSSIHKDPMYVVLAHIGNGLYDIVYGFKIITRGKASYEPWNTLPDNSYEDVITYLTRYKSKLNLINYELHKTNV